MGLKEDALQAADDDRGTEKAELDDTTIELREKFTEWCAVMGIERVPALVITEESYNDNVPEMHFQTIVDDVDLQGHYVRGDKLTMRHGDRELNSLAALGRAVRAEDTID